MANEIFSINGHKMSTIYFDDESFKFSSSNLNSAEDFENSWDKSFTFATKSEIRYGLIEAIKKEENDDNVTISYKASFGTTTHCKFSFSNTNDYERFFNTLENDLGLKKEHETLRPFKAISNHLLKLAITIAITAFSYHEALAIANGTATKSTTSRAKLFDRIVTNLGDKGILLIGGAIACFLLFQMWKRFTNPPNQIIFTIKEI